MISIITIPAPPRGDPEIRFDMRSALEYNLLISDGVGLWRDRGAAKRANEVFAHLETKNARVICVLDQTRKTTMTSLRAFYEKRLWPIAIGEIIAIYFLIYLTSYYDLIPQTRHYVRFLALIPIYQAGVSFGYNGAAISGIVVSVLYMPYMRLDKSVAADPHGVARAIAMIVFINAFGIFVGGVIGKSKRNHALMQSISSSTIEIMRQTDEKSAMLKLLNEAMISVEAERGAVLAQMTESPGIADWRMFASDGERVEEIEYYSSSHPLVWSAREGKTLVSCSARSDDRFARCPEDIPNGPAMSLPVGIGDEQYGAIFLSGKKNDYLFAKHDVAIALALAGTAGAAIHSVRQERKRQEQMAAESSMREIFSRFVSESVADHILGNPEALQGRWQEVTILVSDLRNFTSFSESMPPEQTVRQLNRYFTRMTDAIFENNGTIDKFVGDCIIAYWGAPYPDPDHAAKAARTAILMSEKLDALNREWSLSGDSEFRMGASIHTCMALIGNIGSERKKSFTIMGEDVEKAIELESLTKKYGVDIIFSSAAAGKINGADSGLRPLAKDEEYGDLYTIEIMPGDRRGAFMK